MPSTVLWAIVIPIFEEWILNHLFKPSNESRNLEQSPNSEICLPRSPIRDYNFPSKINCPFNFTIHFQFTSKVFLWWISAEDDFHFLLIHAVFTEEHNDIIPTTSFTVLPYHFCQHEWIRHFVPLLIAIHIYCHKYITWNLHFNSN